MSNLAPRPDYPPNAANGGIDAGRYECDLILGKVERKVYLAYLQAAKEMRKKADDYLEEFLIEDKRRAQLVADGEMNPEDYKNWRISHIAQGRRWYEMAYVLAQDMTNTNEIASGIINDYMPDVFAAGYNYGLYQCEITGGFRTSFTMYDRDTVMRLLRDDPDLLPSSWIDAQKDTAWNQKQFNSAMLQAILQGEPIDDIAERLVNNVSGMNERTAIRHARTAYTSAENGGRYESYRRMKSEGVNLTVEWCATLDGRTRPTHRLADGERHDVDEPFVVDGYNIMYAGDPQAPQKEIWNCRCTMLAWVQGFENDRMWKAQTNPDNMSYAEWKFGKAQELLDTSLKSISQQKKKKQKPEINPDNPSYGYSGRNPERIKPAKPERYKVFDKYGHAVDMGTLYDAQEGDYGEQVIPPKPETKPKPKKKKGKKKRK